jgi:hypothetical protein
MRKKAIYPAILSLIVLSYTLSFGAPHFRETSINARLLFSTAGSQTIEDIENDKSFIVQNGTVHLIFKEFPLSDYVGSLFGAQLNLQLPLNKILSVGPQITFETNTGSKTYYDDGIDTNLTEDIRIKMYTIGGNANLQFPIKNNVSLKSQIGVFNKKENIYRTIREIPQPGYVVGNDYLLLSLCAGPKIALPEEFSIFPHASAFIQYSKVISKKYLAIGIDADKKISRQIRIGAHANLIMPTRQICGGISLGFNE